MKRHEFDRIVQGLIGDFPEEVQDRFSFRFCGEGSYLTSRCEISKAKLTKSQHEQLNVAADALEFDEAEYICNAWGGHSRRKLTEDKREIFWLDINRFFEPTEFASEDSPA